MRTFRFNIAGTDDSSVVQQQTVNCSLHLEPVANISQDQAADCSCHTADDCSSGPRLTGCSDRIMNPPAPDLSFEATGV